MLALGHSPKNDLFPISSVSLIKNTTQKLYISHSISHLLHLLITKPRSAFSLYLHDSSKWVVSSSHLKKGYRPCANNYFHFDIIVEQIFFFISVFNLCNVFHFCSYSIPCFGKSVHSMALGFITFFGEPCNLFSYIPMRTCHNFLMISTHRWSDWVRIEGHTGRAWHTRMIRHESLRWVIAVVSHTLLKWHDWCLIKIIKTRLKIVAIWSKIPLIPNKTH